MNNLETQKQYEFIEKCKEIIAAKEKELGRKLTACVNTFGCQMNARDSEKLVGILEQIGYEITENEASDFVIFNTCTVRENANTRVYGHLGQLKNFKKKNPGMMIALCGCMMQEAHVVEKIKTTYKHVNLIFGTHNIYKFAELLYTSLTSKRMIIDIWKDTDQIVEDLPSERKFSFKSGVNIMFGCNNFCTYCIVPYVRGRERSRKPEDIVREIENLVADGVKEVMLLGQNVNSYGKNLEEPVSFAELLTMIESIEGLERIRFMTPHPKDLSDELIDVMSKSEKICHHIHLPLQSGSSEVLKKMNRKYTKEHYLALVEQIKAKIPDVSLTTDIIVGFPNESEQAFENTLSLCEIVKYDSAFTFIYSPRVGTPAAKMKDNVSMETKKQRFNKLTAVIAKNELEKYKTFENKVVKVLVEGPSKKNPEILSGYTEDMKLVNFKGDINQVGQIVNVKIIKAKTYTLEGEQVD